jgi:hypothetical protein
MRIKNSSNKQERKAISSYGAYRHGESRKARRVAKAWASGLKGKI